MKKKLISLALVAVLCVSCIAPLSFAGDIHPPTTYADYCREPKPTLSISGGSADAKVSVFGYLGTTTKITIYLYLEQYKNGSWVTIGSDWGTFNSHNATVSLNQSVASGYTYRATTTVFPYSGSNLDAIKATSAHVYY